MQNDVQIIKRQGGLGRTSPGTDMVTGFLANGVAVVGGAQLNTVYPLGALADAVALGIDADYDTDNSVLVYEHLKEIYRANPSAPVWFMLVAQATSYANMLDPTVAAGALKLLDKAKGAVNQLAVAHNPAAPVEDDTALLAAIAKAQELATLCFAQYKPLQVLLEGKGFDYTAPLDFRAQNAPDVAVMVGQDISVVNTDATYAAVGTLAGAVSRAGVNVSVLWVEQFNVYGGTLQNPAISGTSYDEISEGIKSDLQAKGAIYFRQHIGRDGIYFNDSSTCVEATSDFAYIENNRTLNKAARLVRQYILPKLGQPVPVDTTTGQLAGEVVKDFENEGRRGLAIMAANSEVSGFDVLIDPAQNILATGELVAEYEVVPTGTGRTIKNYIGFSNPFKA